MDGKGKQTMYFAMIAAALAASLGLAVVAEPVELVSANKRYSIVRQGLLEKAPEAARAPVVEMAVFMPFDQPLGEVIRADGEKLSCDEIRAMDEVELISDDSYCN
jgi:hypothetical protein